LDFLEENWADDIDFVICERNASYFFLGLTGWMDACLEKGLGITPGTLLCASPITLLIRFCPWIRHDDDHKIPRTPSEIFDLNRQVAKKMEKIFLKKGIPVVPSLGIEVPLVPIFWCQLKVYF
jgi:hypothetical protein